jgi:hypothetical protein
MKNRIFGLGFLLIIIITLSCVRDPQKKIQWHHPLYLANNDYWRQRIPVIIRNTTHRELLGDPLEIQIGNNPGEAPLVGVMADGIRVTTANGDQLLYRISDHEGKIIEKGAIPDSSTILIPVECKADTLVTGFIYFDNPSAWAVGEYFSSKMKVNDSITHTVLKNEKLSLKETGKTDKWFDDNNSDQYQWQSRAAIKTINFSSKETGDKIVCVGIEGLLNRLHAEIDKNTVIQITDGLRAIPYYRMGNNIFFAQDISGYSARTNYIYFNSEDKTGGNLIVKDVKNLKDLGQNLIQNPDFKGKNLTGWKDINGIENIKFTTESNSEKEILQLQIASADTGKVIGLEQTLPVQTGASYLFSSWVKNSDAEVSQNDVTNIQKRALRAWFISGNDNSSGKMKTTSLDPSQHRNGEPLVYKVQIDNIWSQVYILFRVPDNADSVRIQLLNTAPGTIWFDNVTVMKVITAETSPLAMERKAAKELKEMAVWQVDPIVKVFQDDLPPKTIPAANISVAQNEYEPLQLAIRSPEAYKNLEIKVISPSDGKGNKLEKLDVGILGYVPIDYPMGYLYDRVTPVWRQKIPYGPYGTDGWQGMWPDPILPFQRFDLSAYKTQPVWIEVNVPKNAVPGDYSGKVQLVNNGDVIKEIPFNVHVWDFKLADKSHMYALYDENTNNRSFYDSGKSQIEIQREIWRMLAKHRLAPDIITPGPIIKIENGRIDFDFTEYDKVASYYFNDLKFSRSYSPNRLFNLFSYANVPGVKFGEKPYPGEYPYTGVDRTKLRPEFKRAYQSALRTYWNHMKEKGWADKILLYVSDEPFAEPAITEQMRALCDMIHEVDPKIPIYVSAWWYRPEYKGYVDVWGISYNTEGLGVAVPGTDQKIIKQNGDRILYTTDSELNTDTPYLGFGRMVPYFCYKYGAEGYEFWGSNWYSINPFEYGWHKFRGESDRPGDRYLCRYPNGDGYIIYPGKPIGVDSLVASIRLKLAREGVEDYEYLYTLDSLVTVGKKQGNDVREAEMALENAKGLAIANVKGRFTTKYLPDPYAVLRVRAQIAEAIEGLLKK